MYYNLLKCCNKMRGLEASLPYNYLKFIISQETLLHKKIIYNSKCLIELAVHSLETGTCYSGKIRTYVAMNI